MSSQKLGNAFALKTEAESLRELREFFKEKGLAKVKVEGPADYYENVNELLHYAAELAPTFHEKETELVLNAIFNLSVPFEADQTATFVTDLCKILNTDAFKGRGWSSNAGVAVRCLSNVFHMYTDRPDIQLLSFKALLEVAGKARITQFADTSLETIDKYAADWQLSVEGRRDLLRVLHNALLADARADAAAEVMNALLTTYTENDANKAKADAFECVRTAIVDPKSFSVDHLLRLTAVRSLKQSDPKTYQILELFSTGLLSDYHKFVIENPNFVRDQLKVDEGLLEKKMKMLSLITLAEKASVLPLDKLSKELDIPNGEDLEEFIIDAIRIKAVNGKINEQKNEFVVTTFQYRTFNRPQWELLQKRLSSLLRNLKKTNENMASMLNVEN